MNVYSAPQIAQLYPCAATYNRRAKWSLRLWLLYAAMVFSALAVGFVWPTP